MKWPLKINKRQDLTAVKWAISFGIVYLGLSQVVWNLARNGLEAMPRGGRLSVRLSRSGSWVVLGVRDEGPGMPLDAQRHATEPFHASKRIHGTGLGLAIVYRIVRENHGDIEIRSMQGSGTEVLVKLPAPTDGSGPGPEPADG